MEQGPFESTEIPPQSQVARTTGLGYSTFMKSIQDWKTVDWPDGVRPRIQHLAERLAAYESVIVAYSGGVDSAFLAVMASRVPGLNVLAVTADSPSIPRRELKEAVALADEWGLNHRVIQTSECDDPRYAKNPEDRCFYCKSALFGTLTDLAKSEGYAVVVDGANADDVSDYRPGSRAARDLGVKSPLQETGFTKDDIRTASRALGLSTAEKPAYACLASRIPYGQPITPDQLLKVERAEDGLLAMGFKQSRVRCHGDVARIELPPDDIQRAAEPGLRERLVEHLTQSGFRYVALDLKGYRQGSMNPV